MSWSTSLKNKGCKDMHRIASIWDKCISALLLTLPGRPPKALSGNPQGLCCKIIASVHKKPGHRPGNGPYSTLSCSCLDCGATYKRKNFGFIDERKWLTFAPWKYIFMIKKKKSTSYGLKVNLMGITIRWKLSCPLIQKSLWKGSCLLILP